MWKFERGNKVKGIENPAGDGGIRWAARCSGYALAARPFRGLSQNRPLSHILAYNQTGKGGSFMHVVVVKSPKCLQKLLKAIFHMK